MAERRSARRAPGELEDEILASVAAAREPVTVQDVQESVRAGLTYSTVHTILNRLVDKGLIERERTGRGHVYQLASEAASVVARQMDALLRRGPSRGAVLRSFLSTLSPSDERFLREWLDGRAERR